MKKVFFLLAMFTYIFASCSDGGNEDPVTPPTQKPEVNDTPAITIDPTIQSSGLSFDVSASEKSITFSTTADWTLSIAETRSGTEWCTASPTSGGKGTATVKFKTTENTEPEDRSVAVTIKAGTASKTFTVTQKGNKSLLVTTKKYELPKEGGEIEIEVKANVEYEMTIAESAKEWITEATGRALTTHKHILAIAASEEAVKREGEITFKSGDIVETVKVYQAGEAVLLLSKNEFTVSEAGETISVDIKSNVDFGVQMPDVDWITEEDASRAMSSHTLKFVVAENESYETRSAEIVFYDKNSELKNTLKIIQTQKDAIILSQKEYEVGVKGDTLKVAINSNVDYKIIISEADKEWISIIENFDSRSLVESNIYIMIAENKIDQKRSGKIVFSNEKGINESITINQEEGKFKINTKLPISVENIKDTLKIELETNLDYTLEIPQEIDWITHINQDFSPNTAIFLQVEANDSWESREAEIYVNPGNLPTIPIIIRQEEGIIKEQVILESKGNLLDLIEKEKLIQVKSLKITGFIGSEDVRLIQELGKTNLTKLDLSEVKLREDGGYMRYDKAPLYVGERNYYRNITVSETKKYQHLASGGGYWITIPSSSGYTIGTSGDAIDKYFFLDCSKLESLMLPQDIEKIDYLAFSGCTNLKEVYLFNSSVEIIVTNTYGEYSAFSGLFADINHEECVLYVPKGSKDTYGNYESWVKSFANIIEME